MENEQIQRKIIELLIKNELAMENLYKKYSEIFTSQRLFWDEILKEEASHADWISTLYNKLDTGLINFAENRFPADAIKENIEYT